ncbi:MAG TPA: GNAT family N-acetyltransferase [Candidatus Acidoferrales bacterium]|nr:GNAT family N-acetyltransferase [Candidatus Acidoferrales bacterium]
MAENRAPIVTVVYPEQQEQVAVSLGRAFINDPTFKPIIPDITEPTARAAHLSDLFRVMLAIERRHGQPVFGVVDEGRVVGAAITEGIAHPSVAGFLLTGLAQMPRLVRAIGWGGIVRAMNMFSVLAENHPKEPHLYLQVLGVDPAFQGRHIGGALLDRLKLEAGARNELAGVYLETATEANVAFYSSKGYEVLGELFPLGVRVWRMFQRKR